MKACPRFDHHDPTVRGDDYYEIYAALRETPISWSDRYGGFWIVSRYDDVRAVLKDWETFASGDGCMLPDRGWRSLGLELDPPRHGPFRKLYLSVGGRTAVSASEHRIEAMVRRVVGVFAEAGGGDAVAEISEILPVEGIALMSGLSESTAAVVREMTVEAWKGVSAEPDPNAFDPLIELLLGEVRARRGSGGEDFLAALANAEVDGSPISDDEIANVLVSAVVAGHETTMNASTNLMLALAGDADLQDRLRKHIDLIPQVVEESLRHRAPVHVFFRTVKKEVTLHDATLRVGDKVAILYASANRDPSRFEAPAAFDPDRAPGHVTFGWGIHRCVGAPLAQTELRFLARELVEHGPFRLAGDVEPAPLEGGHHMGFKRLPLAFG